MTLLLGHTPAFLLLIEQHPLPPLKKFDFTANPPPSSPHSTRSLVSNFVVLSLSRPLPGSQTKHNPPSPTDSHGLQTASRPQIRFHASWPGYLHSHHNNSARFAVFCPPPRDKQTPNKTWAGYVRREEAEQGGTAHNEAAGEWFRGLSFLLPLGVFISNKVPIQGCGLLVRYSRTKQRRKKEQNRREEKEQNKEKRRATR